MNIFDADKLTSSEEMFGVFREFNNRYNLPARQQWDIPLESLVKIQEILNGVGKELSQAQIDIATQALTNLRRVVQNSRGEDGTLIEAKLKKIEACKKTMSLNLAQISQNVKGFQKTLTSAAVRIDRTNVNLIDDFMMPLDFALGRAISWISSDGFEPEITREQQSELADNYLKALDELSKYLAAALKAHPELIEPEIKPEIDSYQTLDVRHVLDHIHPVPGDPSYFSYDNPKSIDRRRTSKLEVLQRTIRVNIRDRKLAIIKPMYDALSKMKNQFLSLLSQEAQSALAITPSSYGPALDTIHDGLIATNLRHIDWCQVHVRSILYALEPSIESSQCMHSKDRLRDTIQRLSQPHEVLTVQYEKILEAASRLERTHVTQVHQLVLEALEMATVQFTLELNSQALKDSASLVPFAAEAKMGDVREHIGRIRLLQSLVQNTERCLKEQRGSSRFVSAEDKSRHLSNVEKILSYFQQAAAAQWASAEVKDPDKTISQQDADLLNAAFSCWNGALQQATKELESYLPKYMANRVGVIEQLLSALDAAPAASAAAAAPAAAAAAAPAASAAASPPASAARDAAVPGTASVISSLFQWLFKRQ